MAHSLLKLFITEYSGEVKPQSLPAFLQEMIVQLVLLNPVFCCLYQSSMAGLLREKVEDTDLHLCYTKGKNILGYPGSYKPEVACLIVS